MRTALFWVIMQRVVVISYQCFGTTYRSHLLGSRTQDSTLLIYLTAEDRNHASYYCCAQKKTMTSAYKGKRLTNGTSLILSVCVCVCVCNSALVKEPPSFIRVSCSFLVVYTIYFRYLITCFTSGFNKFEELYTL